MLRGPGIDQLTTEFAAIVAEQSLGCTAVRGEAIQHRHDVLTAEPLAHLDSSAFPAVHNAYAIVQAARSRPGISRGENREKVVLAPTKSPAAICCATMMALRKLRSWAEVIWSATAQAPRTSPVWTKAFVIHRTQCPPHRNEGALCTVALAPPKSPA